MREIEVLVRCKNSKQEILEKLNDAKFIKSERTIDTYYYDEKRDNLKPDEKDRIKECFRVREADNKSKITYKVDHFAEKDIWLYSDEIETKIENPKSIKMIIEKLGLKQLVVIDNDKSVFETEEYEIELEEVKNLGIFLEVELKNDTGEDVELLKNKIRTFIKNMKLTEVEELNEGKPELMIKKQKNHLN